LIFIAMTPAPVVMRSGGGRSNAQLLEEPTKNGRLGHSLHTPLQLCSPHRKISLA
jgi:hypothetical protein